MIKIQYKNPEDALDYSDYLQATHIDGFVKEPASWLRALERRKWRNRRYVISERLPTMTKMIWKEWPIQPDSWNHMYFYGDAEVYVKTGRAVHGTLNPEIVRGVATYDPHTGLIWYSRAPARHHNLYWIMTEYGVTEYEKSQCIEGFLTSRGNFITREEAMPMARENFQIVRECSNRNQLYSEHLFEGSL